MDILSRQEFEKQKEEFYEKILNGAVFIYPTDTVYGIGCNALNKKSVSKIRKLKRRKDAPFSVIAPSRGWVHTCCVVNGNAAEWMDKLPGPLTIILRKRKTCVAENVAPRLSTLGVRIPQHWFVQHVEHLEIPIVTTSVNKHGEQYMTSLENLDDDFKKSVSFVIYEGERSGRPSKIVDVSDKFKIIER
jgi:tRNA threonylcarbamoyl adenosine modification protein (Sua5/YciO/YrdC/YwlC family)